jgi:tetratricopeptide (TPR) repeat protein
MLKGAHSEPQTTINRAPRNWRAQIDLGYLLLVAGQYREAEEKANLVISQEPNDAHALLANVEAAQGYQDQARSLGPLPSSTWITIRRLSIWAGCKRMASETRKPAA